MSDATLLTKARGATLIPIILSGVWFALLKSTPERFMTVLAVAITFGFFYAVLTGVEMFGRR